MEMLRTQNPLTPRAHPSGARLEPDTARVAVHRPYRFVKDPQPKHRYVGGQRETHIAVRRRARRRRTKDSARVRAMGSTPPAHYSRDA